MPSAHAVIACARTDAHDRLVAAEEPLAGLQLRCGGELPGTVAVPQLLEVVRKARTLGLKLARTIEAFDGVDTVRAWVEIAPDNGDEADGSIGGCSISVGAWQTAPRSAAADAVAAERKVEIDRALAELTARLDPRQGVLAVYTRASDLAGLAQAMRDAPGRPWSDHVRFPAISHHQPLHWRLLDGAECEVPGSLRKWTASLIPLGQPDRGGGGFELLMVADAPLPAAAAKVVKARTSGTTFGRELTPVLRQPIARIIANAETIRSRLAGPLAEEYSNYAADIAAAGQHLLSLIDDLSDLEVVEAEDFVTTPDRIDLAEVARQAAGILSVQARERGIQIDGVGNQAHMLARAEFRRVLQILLNLIGNAIRYSPSGSTITIGLEREGKVARISVSDEGEGLSEAQQATVFDKFERLGRSGDGGSGLGLYISRRLAEAMAGTLTIESEPGQGARFVLGLPAFDDRRKKAR